MEIGFLIGFSFCVITLLFILRWAKIHWTLKAALTLSAIPVVFLLHNAFLNSLGWPANDTPYDHTLRFIASEIREPSPNDKGAIYIWYVDIDEEKQTHKIVLPRAVALPYTKQDHDKTSLAKEFSRQNIFTFMKIKKHNKGVQGKNDSNDSSSQGDVDFVPPPYTLPQKHQDK